MSSQIMSLNTERGVFRVCLDGDPSAPPLMLSNSLGTTLEMWDPQVAALSGKYRLLRYDTRGHGHSPVTPGPYSFAELGKDVIAILDALGIERVAFGGISMGGHIALWLGVNAPERINALMVCNSAARIGTEQVWRERAAVIDKHGQESMRMLAEGAVARWFTEAYAKRNPKVIQGILDRFVQNDHRGYAACCQALETSDLRQDIKRIKAPVLLLTGDKDPVTTVTDSLAMLASIPNARLVVLMAAHLSNIEAADEFNATVIHFLDENLKAVA